MSGLYIKSDFNDFYDVLSDEQSAIAYNRYLSDCKQRGAALKYLRNIGIKTLEIKQVTNFFMGDGQIVVYKNPKAHNSTGKEVMTIDSAMQTYSNCVASKYYKDSLMTIKFLQIGKRRFTLYYKKDRPSLELGKLVDIREAVPEYNRLLALPIFSIDYISDGEMMIATDFNEVENLQRLGMNMYISANDVVNEIIESLKIYNKI